MFETAELGHKVSNSEFKQQLPALREALLMAQAELRDAVFPVILLFAGVDGAGKSEMVNTLNGWMDPHYILTRPVGAPSQEELERPTYWRFWRDLPPKGHIGVFLSAWYHLPLLDRAYGRVKLAELDEQLDDVIAFEQMLADDGALILKFWMHLGRTPQKKRLKRLEKDPLQSWRVTDRDWNHYEMYDKFASAAEHIIMRTSTGPAPWHIVEGVDGNYRSLRVGNILVEALRRRLASEEVRLLAREQELKSAAPLPEALRPPVTVLDRVDLSKTLERDEYKTRLKEGQARLSWLHRQMREQGRSAVLVFEGWDAAGKGSAIKRVVRALDARSVRIIPIAAPTDEERAQHYLWRFWRHMMRTGRVVFFDRSWYGRVLVERVEGFATESEWRRAYNEINVFERQLVDHGIVVLKFWAHLSKQEQEARFTLREQTPYKKWKLTEEDWRNREKWAEYELAVHDMVERTSTKGAPWHLIAGEDKRWARCEVLEIVNAAFEEALGL